MSAKRPRAELAARQKELLTLTTNESQLAKSEALLEQRLWEVQETRRRHAAMADQLREAVAALELKVRDHCDLRVISRDLS